MIDTLKLLLNEIKKNSLFSMFSHKNIIIVGFIVSIAYFIRINHYPTNMSIENGATILLISYISGTFYITLWSAIISLGWIIAAAANKYIPAKKICILKMIGDTLKIDLANRTDQTLRVILGLIFLAVIIFSSTWCMATLAVVASMFIYPVTIILAFTIKTQNKPGLRATNNEFPPLLLHVTILFFLIIPISMSVIYDFASIGQLIDKTMEIVGIRVKDKDIYIKSPYGEIFAANTRNTTPVGNNFIILKNATILLNDIGGETLISYRDDQTIKRLSIPSAYVSLGEAIELPRKK